MDWQPITRGEPTIVGDDPRNVEVRVPLSAFPPVDDAWTEGFEHPKNVKYLESKYGGPTVVNDVIRFNCPAGDVSEILEGIDHRLAQANAGYVERLAELRRRGIT